MTTRQRELMRVVPYPADVRNLPGRGLFTSSAVFELPRVADSKEKLARDMIKSRLRDAPPSSRPVRFRIGSLETLKQERSWLTDEQRSFLTSAKSGQAYVLRVSGGEVLIVGRTPIAALYGAQTFLQALTKTGAGYSMANVDVRDFPEVESRFLAIAMSWYAGYGRTGFASQLWGREQWLWFIDWCLAHKVNGVSICMYGYYPFQFEEYPETVFKDVESRTWLAEAGKEIKVRYTHPNVQEEFLPEVIRYANARGITVLCYFGLNTFNGGYALAHPESRYQADDPEKFHQFKFNLCPSRRDVRRYLDASVRRIMRIGFNGLLLEESEGSGLCECASCVKRYYGTDPDSRRALHRADYELFNRLYSIAREERSDAVIGIRMWRMGSETGIDALSEGKKKIPRDTLVFWSNGMDYERFKGWVDVFGPERMMGQDAELLGFSALYDGLVYMLPEQYSSYVKNVDPGFRPSYPQSLPNDVRQYQQAAKLGCAGVTGYAFNWNGWELGPYSLAQYGWNPGKFAVDEFIHHAYAHQFGESGRTVAKAVATLPIVLETRICEGSKSVPRDDPVSGGLAGLTSLQVPTKFGEGDGEDMALRADLRRAEASLRLFRSVSLGDGSDEQDRITLGYFENAAARTVFICRAALEYRSALRLERENGSKRSIADHLAKSLHWTMEDYRVVRESAFDLGEEFHDRILEAISTISARLARYQSPAKA